MRAPFATAIAISVGLVILAGYFVPLPLMTDLQSTLLGWAVILAAFAGLVGIVNLALNHWRKAVSKVKNQRDPYSILLLVAFGVTLAAGLWFGPADAVMQQVVLSIQVPVEASLMAALAFALGYASLRLMRRRQGGMAVIFVISALVFLIILSGFLVGLNIPLVRDISLFIDRLPVAGARGILLGIALGGLVTGLRVILGADRPYSG
jgi:hypothetical protein